MSRELLERDLRQYAFDLFALDVAKDAVKQVGVWEAHINTIIACAKTAQKNQQQELDKIKKQMQMSQEAALFALSLLGGPALSMFSGFLQYKVFPKVFGKSSTTSSYVAVNRPKAPTPPPTPKAPPAPTTRKQELDQQYANLKDKLKNTPVRPEKKENVNARGYKEQQDNINKAKKVVETPKPPSDKYYVVDQESHSKVGAKVLGDTAGSMVSMGVNAAIRPKPPKAEIEALRVAQARVDDSRSIEFLEANLKNAVIAAKTYVDAVIQSYARTIMEDMNYGKNLLNEIARQAPNGNSEHALELYGRKVIKERMERKRAEWAREREWFYYGHDPAPLSISIAVNTFEAQFWALWIQDEEFKLVTKTYYYGEPYGVDKVETEGRSGVKLDKAVMRLMRLGVVTANHEYERIRRTIAKVDNADGLLPAEINDVDDWINTAKELDSINNWSRKGQSPLTMARSGASPRSLAPLVESAKGKG